MKHKRCIKMLMGIGIQRNDAAAFARVYNKILLTGRQHYFPALAQMLLRQESPIAKRPLQTATLRASYHMDSYKVQLLKRDGVLNDYIRDRLFKELAEGLKESDVIKIEQDSGISWLGDVRYTATLRLIIPEDGP